MSFWEKAGAIAIKTAKVTYSAASVASNQIEAQANDIKQTRKEYESKSDEELENIIKSTGFFAKSRQEKGIAASLLRQRRQPTSNHS